jgi:mono/diheme cytochrome c family protein
MKSWLRLGALGVAAAIASATIVLVLPARAQHDHHHGAPGAPSTAVTPPTARGVRLSMEELHRAGGVPRGWRFSWPDGDAKKGREVFARLECYRCHEVKGEPFPPVAPDPARRGPALAGMGDHHPAEYFAESVLNPNAVIVTAPGYTGPDGLSIMPDFRDSLTLAETIDLVAYVRSLTGGDHAHHPPALADRERVAGHYRVRLLYAAADHGHGHHHHHGAGVAAPAHLMVFVRDATLGEPVPYLPVSATIHADGAAPRVVRLTPMLGRQGFHYGADVTVPAATRKIVVAVGKPMLRVMSTVSDRFARDAEVSFEWGK